MKKCIAIVTLLLHIVCAATVSVSAHVCGGEVADIAVGHSEANGCGMESEENAGCATTASVDEACCSDSSVDFATEQTVPSKELKYKTLAVVILNIFADALVLHAEAHKPQPLSAADLPPPHAHSHDLQFKQCMLI